MKVFNFGSLNIDHVYSVPRFALPGETIASLRYERFGGGKGCNQSVALAHAGASVVHVGRIGIDGGWLRDRLAESGADVSLVTIGAEPTGHAIIQVAPNGENSILIFGGANQTLGEADIARVLDAAEPGDWVLTQNETSCVDLLLERASRRGLLTAFNPAPLTDSVRSYPLDEVSLLFVNETEGRGLTGESEPGAILDSLLERYPDSRVVLTLGDKGARYRDRDCELHIPAEVVDAVDTTGAGDTFIGYFLAELCRGSGFETCLRMACKAAAICVQRAGAIDSIPRRVELLG